MLTDHVRICSEPANTRCVSQEVWASSSNVHIFLALVDSPDTPKGGDIFEFQARILKAQIR